MVCNSGFTILLHHNVKFSSHPYQSIYQGIPPANPARTARMDSLPPRTLLLSRREYSPVWRNLRMLVQSTKRALRHCLRSAEHAQQQETREFPTSADDITLFWRIACPSPRRETQVRLRCFSTTDRSAPVEPDVEVIFGKREYRHPKQNHQRRTPRCRRRFTHLGNFSRQRPRRKCHRYLVL